MNKLFLIIVSLFILASCSSTTELRTIPSGAKVWVDGELLGLSPVSYYDRYLAGSTVKATFIKKGYEDRSVEITKDCLYVHRIFWFPVLSWPWITGYREQYTFELNKKANPTKIEKAITPPQATKIEPIINPAEDEIDYSQKLLKGETTKEDVERDFGKPAEAEMSASGEYEYWAYFYRNTSQNAFLGTADHTINKLILKFDKNGILEDYRNKTLQQ